MIESTLKRLKDSGFNYIVESFGITVYKDKKLVFHGIADEVNEWLWENREGVESEL